MKHLLKTALGLAFCVLLLCTFTVTACAESGTAGDLNWEIRSGVLYITGEGMIPDYNQGGAPWHPYRESVSRIEISDGVTSIGKNAFAGMTTPGRITLGADITTIGDYAFDGCTSLSRVAFPEGLLSIGENAFYNCDSLGGVTLPDSLRQMGESAFSDCDALGTVKTGNGLKKINRYAFYNCDGLSMVLVGDGVAEIGEMAFASCDSLANVTIGKGVTSIGYAAFGGNSNNYSSYGCKNLRSIVIPDNVTSIGTYAFAGSGLETVTMGSGVTSIGGCAFYYCQSLSNVTLGEGLTSIGNDAFYYCTSLTSIVIPDSVTNIGSEAFSKCSKLTSATLGENVVKLDTYAFAGCSLLKTITVGEWLSTVEANAFSDCGDLSDVYYSGTEEDRDYISIKTGNDLFKNATWHYGVSPTYTVTYDANGGTGAPPSQTKIHDTALTLSSDKPIREASTGNYRVRMQFVEDDGTTKTSDAVLWPWTISYIFKNWNTAANGSGTSYNPDESYTVNASATLYAQWNSTKTTEAIPLPNPPTRPGYVFMGWATTKTASHGAFSYTPTRDGDATLYTTWKEMDFILPETLTVIESEAFNGCAFSSVKLSENTTTIGRFAFADCPNLKYIYIPAATENIDLYAFIGVDGLTILGKIGSYAETYAQENGFAFLPAA